MENSFQVKIAFCLIAIVVLTLPAKGRCQDYYLIGGREQELVSAEVAQRLLRIHYARARNYYRKGEYKKAKEEFQEVLKFDPEHQGAQWYLGLIERELNKYKRTFFSRELKEKRKKENLKATLDSLEQCEDKLCKEKTRLEQLEKEKAKLARQLKEYKRLLKKQREEQKRRARQERLTRHRAIKQHLAQGKLYYWQKQYAKAIEEFKQVLLLDAEYPNIERYIHKCQRGIEEQRQKELQVKEKKEEAKRLKKAGETLKRAGEEKYKKIMEFYEKGKDYLQRGFYSEAIACFEKVLELEKRP